VHFGILATDLHPEMSKTAWSDIAHKSRTKILGRLINPEVALAYLRAISHPITGRILKLDKTNS
jgi:hypothetical protein